MKLATKTLLGAVILASSLITSVQATVHSQMGIVFVSPPIASNQGAIVSLDPAIGKLIRGQNVAQRYLTKRRINPANHVDYLAGTQALIN